MERQAMGRQAMRRNTMGRQVKRNAVLVALTLGALCTGTVTHAGTATAQDVIAQAPVAASATEGSRSRSTAGVADDVPAAASITLSFRPGTADAAGSMADVEVDAYGSWCLPAVCFVADGLHPLGWQVAGAGAAPILPAATTVDGLVADLTRPDETRRALDLAPYVQGGTLELVAVWEPGRSSGETDEEAQGDAPAARNSQTAGDATDESADEYTNEEASVDAAALVAANDTMSAYGRRHAQEDDAAGVTTDGTSDHLSEDAADDHVDDSVDDTVDDPADDTADASAKAGHEHARPQDREADEEDGLALADTLSLQAGTGDGDAEGDGPALDWARGIALQAASDTPTADPVTTGEAVAIAHGDTLTITRMEGAPAGELSGTFTDVLGDAYEGTCYAIDEATGDAAWTGGTLDVVYVEVADGVRVAPASCEGWFQGMERLVAADLEGLDLSGCANVAGMFSGCASLVSLEASSWDLSHATRMDCAFAGCASLATLDASGWGANRATNLSRCFEGCASLAELDVSGWRPTRLTSCDRMFSGCASLASLDLSGWGTRGQRHCAAMFRGCASLEELRLGGLNTSRCTDLSYLLAGCASLTDVDLASVSVASATDLSHALEGCASLADVDLAAWDTSSVRDLSHLLDGCDALAELDLSPLSTASATDLTALIPTGGALGRVTLGGAFTFAGAADAEHAASMPEAPDAPPHTGRWVHEETGVSLTAAELTEAYDAATMAGTWSWEVGWAPLELDLDGGSEPEGAEYPAWYRLGDQTPLPGTKGSGLGAPTRAGRVFAGWQDEEGDPVDSIDASSTGTRTVTATWEVAQVRVTVPVALTLEGTPDGTGALVLAAGAEDDAAVTNDGDTDVVASLALAGAPKSLSLEIAGDDGTVALSDTPRDVRTIGAAGELPLAGITGHMDAEDVEDAGDAPVATLAWSFRFAE